MNSRPLKRRSSSDDADLLPQAKRPRNDELPPPDAASANPPTRTIAPPTSTEELMRANLRRSIVLALDHVGFSSTSEAALERFTEMTEEYLSSFADDVKRFAEESRRAVANPLDFEHVLKRFNLGTSGLRPHLRNPISRRKLAPKYAPMVVLADEDGAQRELPLLGEELSGRVEKEEKSYIPSSFPAFPSIHTYKATPQDLDEVTVQGTGLLWSDTGKPYDGKNGTEGKEAVEEAHWQLGPRGDPQKIREASSRESKQAEEALRGVVRASKINQLKEARLAAQRNRYSRQRYDLWDGLMRGMIEDFPARSPAAAGGTGGHAPPSQDGRGGSPNNNNNSNGRVEIADHSMIVNAQKSNHRQEVPRTGKRISAGDR